MKYRLLSSLFLTIFLFVTVVPIGCCAAYCKCLNISTKHESFGMSGPCHEFDESDEDEAAAADNETKLSSFAKHEVRGCCPKKRLASVVEFAVPISVFEMDLRSLRVCTSITVFSQNLFFDEDTPPPKLFM